MPISDFGNRHGVPNFETVNRYGVPLFTILDLMPLALALAAWAGFADAAPRKDTAAWARRQLMAMEEEAQLELRKLYMNYSALVRAKKAEGWSPGTYGAPVADDPVPRPPARQIAESLARKVPELKELETRLKTAASKEARKAARALRADIRRLKRQDRREKGTTEDWSDAVWDEFSRAKPRAWSTRETTRPTGLRHSAAVLCENAAPEPVCLVFDPWPSGQPDVFLFDQWEEGRTDAPLPPEIFEADLAQE